MKTSCVPFYGMDKNDGMRLQVFGEKAFLSEIPFIQFYLHKTIVVQWEFLAVISFSKKRAECP